MAPRSTQYEVLDKNGQDVVEWLREKGRTQNAIFHLPLCLFVWRPHIVSWHRQSIGALVAGLVMKG